MVAIVSQLCGSSNNDSIDEKGHRLLSSQLIPIHLEHFLGPIIDAELEDQLFEERQ
jgi:hypothetical protein